MLTKFAIACQNIRYMCKNGIDIEFSLKCSYKYCYYCHFCMYISFNCNWLISVCERSFCFSLVLDTDNFPRSAAPVTHLLVFLFQFGSGY